jgi:hypothetical protein
MLRALYKRFSYLWTIGYGKEKKKKITAVGDREQTFLLCIGLEHMLEKAKFEIRLLFKIYMEEECNSN